MMISIIIGSCLRGIKTRQVPKNLNLELDIIERLPKIVSFILADMCSMFDNVSEDEIIDALGTPLIDLDKEVVIYLEQTLDDCHIIEVEYGGLLEEFYGVVIDG